DRHAQGRAEARQQSARDRDLPASARSPRSGAKLTRSGLGTRRKDSLLTNLRPARAIRCVRKAMIARPRTRADSDGKLDVLPQLTKDQHKPVERKACGVGFPDAGKIGVAYSGCFVGLPRGPVSGVENFHDLGGKKAFGLTHIGVRIAEIAKDIAAPVHKLKITLVHRSSSVSRTNRLRINSISTRGVLMPVFDFF